MAKRAGVQSRNVGRQKFAMRQVKRTITAHDVLRNFQDRTEALRMCEHSIADALHQVRALELLSI